ILYAAPVWAEAMGVRSYARGIEADHRLCALRTSCAFRTVSDDAALVIAGLIPIQELVRQRMELANMAQDSLSSALSGHGCFRSYLKRFGHESEDLCPSCGSEVTEDPLHVLFECRRFVEDRLTMEEILEEPFTPSSMVPLVLQTPGKWEAIAVYVAKTMMELRALERARNGRE
ncbi:hypothetical protein KR026_011890, partial [Drosophila bipectinata]